LKIDDKTTTFYNQLDAMPANLKVALNDKHSAKIAWNRKRALNIQSHVHSYLSEKGFTLPKSYNDYRNNKKELFESVELIDEITGEVANGQQFEELAKYYYAIGNAGKGIYALFESKGGSKRSQILCCQYSRKRVDPVWEMRLRQMVAKMYANWLSETQAQREYHACHMVLTVPHPGGYFELKNQKGQVIERKRHYAKELIKAFTEMRKTDTFKKYIWGGEYGVEIKRGRVGNGLHIHIHSLCFQYRQHTVNEVRTALQALWLKFSGATVMHYESLYLREKSHQVATTNEAGETEFIWKYVKRYLTEASPPSDMLRGVLECVKYHFKTSELESNNGQAIDVELLNELLQGCKGVRLISRFGALYGDERLCINKQKRNTEALEKAEAIAQRLVTSQTVTRAERRYKLAASKLVKAESKALEQTHALRLAALQKVAAGDLQAAAILQEQLFAHEALCTTTLAFLRDKAAALKIAMEVAAQKKTDRLDVLAGKIERLHEATSKSEEDLLADTDKVLERLTNPLTLMPAEPGKYKIVASQPEAIKHLNKQAIEQYRPLWSHVPYWQLQEGVSLKETMKNVCTGKLNELLVPEDRDKFQQFERERMAAKISNSQFATT